MTVTGRATLAAVFALPAVTQARTTAETTKWAKVLREAGGRPD